MRIEFNITSNGGRAPQGIGAKAVDMIRAAMERAEINASGQTARSLGFDETEERLTIYAEGPHAPIFTLQHGSGPHRTPTPEGFPEAIREWVRIKHGFVPRQREGETLERAQERAAQAIIHSIRKRGTLRFSKPIENIYSPALDYALEAFSKKAGSIIVEKMLK